MTFGCQTWSPNKQLTQNLRTAQTAAQRKMLNVKQLRTILRDQRKTDIVEYILKQKWKWAGHVARMKDNRWTKRFTEWQPRIGKGLYILEDDQAQGGRMI